MDHNTPDQKKVMFVFAVIKAEKDMAEFDLIIFMHF